MRNSQKIIILGGGFAGAYCAQALERRLARQNIKADILLINRTNYFVFFPLLMEAGTGSLQPRHAVVSIRAFLRTTRFLMSELLDLDVDQQQITYRLVGAEEQQAIPYDHLVIAVGSVTRLPPVSARATKATERTCWKRFLKTRPTNPYNQPQGQIARAVTRSDC